MLYDFILLIAIALGSWTNRETIQRSGIRLADVFNPEVFESKLRRLAAGYRKRFGDLLEYDVEEEIAKFNEYRPKLAKYAVDAVPFMKHAQESNMNIIVEGANVSGLWTLEAFNSFLLTIWGLGKCATAPLVSLAK